VTKRRREAAPAEGVRDKRPAYDLTERQASAFERVRQAAYVEAAAPETDGGETDREGDRDASADGEGQDTRVLVLEFFYRVDGPRYWRQGVPERIIQRLAVLGIEVAHGWRSALVYTPQLSAIVTVAHMFVLFKATQDRRAHIEQRRQATGESEQEAGRKTQGHFHRVRRMVQKFMTIVEYNGPPSPMDSILRLRAYLNALRATRMRTVVDWHGDESLYGHVQFNMGSLLVHGLLYSTKAQLQQEILLLDTDREIDSEGEVRAGLPHIKWHRLVDNAAETRAGWNFVDDPRNEEALGGVDWKMWLASRSRLFALHQLDQLKECP
jgi:hypothetical protein